MPASLEGKIAVVTGVSLQGQIGETVAKALAGRGAALAICARTRSNVEARAVDLRQAGARVLAVAASLTEERPGAKQLVEAAIKEYERIDVLVNLAGGLTRYKPIVEHSLDDSEHGTEQQSSERVFSLSRGFSAHAGRWRRCDHQLHACRTVSTRIWSPITVPKRGLKL